jgi:uncharacterized membrane protein YfcA
LLYFYQRKIYNLQYININNIGGYYAAGYSFFILLCGLIIGIFSLEFSAGGGVVIVPYNEGLDITAPGYNDGHIRNY